MAQMESLTAEIEAESRVDVMDSTDVTLMETVDLEKKRKFGIVYMSEHILRITRPSGPGSGLCACQRQTWQEAYPLSDADDDWN